MTVTFICPHHVDVFIGVFSFAPLEYNQCIVFEQAVRRAGVVGVMRCFSDWRAASTSFMVCRVASHSCMASNTAAGKAIFRCVGWKLKEFMLDLVGMLPSN